MHRWDAEPQIPKSYRNVHDKAIKVHLLKTVLAVQEEWRKAMTVKTDIMLELEVLRKQVVILRNDKLQMQRELDTLKQNHGSSSITQDRRCGSMSLKRSDSDVWSIVTDNNSNGVVRKVSTQEEKMDTPKHKRPIGDPVNMEPFTDENMVTINQLIKSTNEDRSIDPVQGQESGNTSPKSPTSPSWSMIASPSWRTTSTSSTIEREHFITLFDPTRELNLKYSRFRSPYDVKQPLLKRQISEFCATQEDDRDKPRSSEPVIFSSNALTESKILNRHNRKKEREKSRREPNKPRRQIGLFELMRLNEIKRRKREKAPRHDECF